MNDFIFKIDHAVAKFFHSIYAWGGEFANGFMKGISFIAEAGILFLLVGLGLALFKRTRKIGGTILLAVAFGFLFTNVILKNVVERARPFSNIMSEYYNWWLDAGANFEGGYSFPSGHTTATCAFAVAIFLTTNKKYSWYILLLPIAMASSRIYLMVHYFTDCLGGLVVGSVCAGLAYLIVKLIYASKAKFFIWLREFDIRNPKAPISMTSNSKVYTKPQTETTSSDYKEEFVYSTQEEELKSQQNAEEELKQTNQSKNIDSDE